MNRRQFMQGAALASATAGLANLTGAWVTARESEASVASLQDGADRSPTRDPLAVQRSTLVVNGLDVSQLTEKYLGMLKTGGVNCWHKSVGLDPNYLTGLYEVVDNNSDKITVATTVKEIRQAHQQGKISLVFGWQDADALGADINNPLGPPRTTLRAYYHMGLRIVGIAYNVTNVFGAGNLEPHIGLTRAGRLLVEEIHKLRMILDVGGHTGEQTSFDAIGISTGVPVICSHTNIAAIADNPRCISDRLIEAIAKTGGVIGITAVNDFHIRTRKDANVPHSPRVTVEKYIDQLDYIRKLVGVDHAGLGPDFVEGRTINYDAVNRHVIPREMVSDGRWLYVKGFENIAELPNVTRGLIQRGWSTEEIRKVMGENWLRVYQKVWGA
ncbi:MAG: membrane dipeptidase [Acidobacteria bacterium]|nr:membrane dipeptidase [Acidobacteriota bacterium]